MINPGATIQKKVPAKCWIGFRINGLDSGETITACTATVSPASLTLTGSVVIDGIKIAQFIEAGVAGTDYVVSFSYETSAGNKDRLDFLVKVVA